MIDQNKGPIYGVILPDFLPLDGTSCQQVFPNRKELELVRERVGDRTVAALEVLVHYWRHLYQAIERSGFDLSPCKQCGEAVVCIPDGLAMCRSCAEKAAS